MFVFVYTRKVFDSFDSLAKIGLHREVKFLFFGGVLRPPSYVVSVAMSSKLCRKLSLNNLLFNTLPFDLSQNLKKRYK